MQRPFKEFCIPSGGAREIARCAIATVAGFLLLASCGGASATVDIRRVPTDYQVWQRTTDATLDYPIPGHENKYRVPRMNGVGFGFKLKGEGLERRVEFPPGTIIAKEIYANNPPAAGESPIMATVMIKSPSDPDAVGGWVWIVKNPANGPESVVKSKFFCFSCHSNANEKHPYADGNPGGMFRDFVFFVPGFDKKVSGNNP